MFSQSIELEAAVAVTQPPTDSKNKLTNIAKSFFCSLDTFISINTSLSCSYCAPIQINRAE
jgi:hypothetical protein